MKVRIFVTGGTFDKIFDEVGGVMTFRDTHLYEMLDLVKNKLDIEIETVMLVDSLYMKEDDRIKILEKCKSCKEDKIIITHGTDTMIETAKLLGKGIKDKTIVLTGATIPYSFGKSDALFNLGCAFGFVQLIEKGIYVTMNGTLFNYNNVKKNKEVGKFETIK